ncbi:cadmium-translocating P-type ATPase [Robertmurraya korlensis]|uniref:heavy metal translocating P-type ATPase n=1 Tax=Robertmurraya korlensis TaxID=519977 RepID=UPI002040873B|nr:heavy metal translocating P-type ATPase [Robertmurraya korlensis]MCM3600753.1 cadmium-translocating P-type ATPase [Robertmurraya korlensis]
MTNSKQVYRVQGLTCASCAKKFETNVKNLDGVFDANINFGAAKLTVFGEATLVELEKAGAFDGIKVQPEKARIQEVKEPFFQKYATVLASFVLLLLGWAIGEVSGEESLASIGAYAFSMILGGYRLFQTGFKNLLRLEFDMKTLMTIAVIGAAVIGEWGEGATVVILFAISEVLESYSMNKARQSIRSLMDIAPKEAMIRRGLQEMVIDVEDIQINDVLLVKPGQKLAMDGIIVKGISSINQAAITGESVPVAKGVNDEVYAGTLNEEGFLEVKVTKHVEDTTIAKIIHLVEEAQAEKAPSQAFVDRFAKYYTPIIMLFALGVAVVPPLLLGAEWNEWVYQGLAVLVVGCPCALVISTPVAIVTAIGNAAKRGVLIKGGIHLEEMGAIKAIAFDKTGTLTKGIPVVTDYETAPNIPANETFALISALEKVSQHPLASAILKKADQWELNYDHLELEEFTSVTGKGVLGKVAGTEYYVGSPIFIHKQLKGGLPAVYREKITVLEKQGKTVMAVCSSEHFLAIVAVADEIRGETKDVVQQLHSLGLQKTIMLTGDNEGTAKAIGQKAGVNEVKANLLPQEKLSFIKELRATYQRVAMVGDGVNDAPALAASSVGIAMGGAGTDTALETADIALMADDLRKLPFTVKLSRKALNIIKQNITFSLGIKLLALLLVVPGWLTLWIAIFADMGATLIVTLNSLRLLQVKDES